jgi:hypothetical protein
VFGHTGPDRPAGQSIRDAVDGRVADPAQPETHQYADEQSTDVRQPDDLGDIHRHDNLSATHDDEPPAFAQDGSASGAPVVDEPAAGPHADKPHSLDGPTDPKAGDVPTAALTTIWADDSAQDLRDRWREAQLRFVDDPKKAADDIRSLVNEAVDALTAALGSRCEQLNSLPTNGDTEQYRVVVQRYRTLFEHLLTL